MQRRERERGGILPGLHNILDYFPPRILQDIRMYIKQRKEKIFRKYFVKINKWNLIIGFELVNSDAHCVGTGELLGTSKPTITNLTLHTPPQP